MGLKAGAASTDILIAEIVGAHGVRGAVRVKSHAEDPAAIGRYKLRDARGNAVKLRLAGTVRGNLIATLEGISDRDAAEALRGMRLYVARSALPRTDEDEFYHADLIGLAAETPDGAPFGTVEAVVNHGAGDVLEIRPAAGGVTVLVPFSKAAVPLVDLAGRRIVVDPPAGLLDPPGAPEPGEDAG
ncbi:MAG: ribosome maturation factor RimM [Alphaproteobacteria bacterium]